MIESLITGVNAFIRKYVVFSLEKMLHSARNALMKVPELLLEERSKSVERVQLVSYGETVTLRVPLVNSSSGLKQQNWFCFTQYSVRPP